MDFSAVNTQIVNYSLFGYAPAPLNYFHELTVTFVINNLQISYQNITLLLYKPNIWGAIPHWSPWLRLCLGSKF